MCENVYVFVAVCMCVCVCVCVCVLYAEVRIYFQKVYILTTQQVPLPPSLLAWRPTEAVVYCPAAVDVVGS